MTSRVQQEPEGRPDSNARPRLVGYCRVSSRAQADDGLSLDSQQKKLRLYCKLSDALLVGVESDPARSGGRFDRPGLQRALDRLGGDADGILVVKLDRLTRSIVDLGMMLRTYFGPKLPYRLVSVVENIDTQTAGGRLVANMLMAVAEWEREAASERTSAVKADQRERGEFLGGEPPYGYRVQDGKLVPDERERQAMESARQLRTRLGSSLQEIADALNEDGVPRRNGRPWTRQAIGRLLE